MFDDLEVDSLDDARADRALSAGLRDLLTSETSVDFETHIMAGLVRRPPWWQTAWIAVRPAVPTAIGALSVMLLLLHMAQRAPIGVPHTRSSMIAREANRRNRRAHARGTTQQGSPLESMESMHNIDLNSASLSFLSNPIRRIPDNRG